MTKYYSPNRLYKDPRNGRIMGVCAGLADWMGVRPCVVRCLTVLGMIFGLFVPIVIIYFVLGLVLDKRPDGLYQDEREEEFWRNVRRQPSYSAVDLKRRFREIDKRVQRMEAYMTSKRFRLEREINNLGK